MSLCDFEQGRIGTAEGVGQQIVGVGVGGPDRVANVALRGFVNVGGVVVSAAFGLASSFTFLVVSVISSLFSFLNMGATLSLFTMTALSDGMFAVLSGATPVGVGGHGGHGGTCLRRH